MARASNPPTLGQHFVFYQVIFQREKNLFQHLQTQCTRTGWQEDGVKGLLILFIQKNDMFKNLIH